MDHDSGYHLLFSNPVLVCELVKGFVSEPWVSEIDFSSIKRVNAKQHATSLDRREGDIIYELRSFKGKYLYLYLFLEFQSKPDRWMALRLSVYVQLFWQQLIKERNLTGSQKLPPVFPLVLYNGNPQWNCANSLSQLVDLPQESSLWHFQPEMQYYLVDEQRSAQSIDEEEISEHTNATSLVSLLFQLENCNSPARMQYLVNKLVQLALRPEYQAAKRDLASWLKQVLLPGFLNKQGKQGNTRSLSEIDSLNLSELSEVKHMLADRIKQWEAELIEQGIEQGAERGGLVASREMLTQLLQQKFGKLSIEAIKTIEVYNADELGECLMRILRAKKVDEVINN